MLVLDSTGKILTAGGDELMPGQDHRVLTAQEAEQHMRSISPTLGQIDCVQIGQRAIYNMDLIARHEQMLATYRSVFSVAGGGYEALY
jgi:hypothetical protein